MSRLVRVEIARFFARRAVRMSGMLLVLGLVLAGSLTFALSHRDVAAATGAARAAATEEHAVCLRDEATFGAERCGQLELSQVTADPRFHLAHLPDVFRGASAALVMLGIAIGASFVGGEWNHRTMTSLLTWEPRRSRVAAAKFAAIAVSAFGAVLVFEALLGGALTPAAAFRGTTAGVDLGWFGEVAGVAARGAALASMGAVLGAAAAFVARSSALALGIAFGWLAVGENVLRNLRPGWAGWLVGDNAVSFIAPGIDAPRSAAGGGTMVAIYVAFAALAATAVFRRRDIA
ncbi:MAG TPA: ABC transporter permease subunit [Actinomycetota bacterium]|nr:ABC transporter permease subunit [Actinomycetota bacterium]